METTSNIMILGTKEYRELCKISAGFFISGGILVIYNMDGDSALAFCNTLKRYKRLGTFKDDVENERLIKTAKMSYSFENTMYGTLGPERTVWDEEANEAMKEAVKKNN